MASPPTVERIADESNSVMMVPGPTTAIASFSSSTPPKAPAADKAPVDAALDELAPAPSSTIAASGAGAVLPTTTAVGAGDEDASVAFDHMAHATAIVASSEGDEDDEVDGDDESGKSEQDDDEPEGYRDTKRFKRWRKHVRDMYQSLAVFETVWPSVTCQFLPYVRTGGLSGADGSITQTLLTGTNTQGLEQNYLRLLTLTLPMDNSAKLRPDYLPEIGEMGGYGFAPSYVDCAVSIRMFHDGSVQRARVMPQNPNVFGTASSNGNCYIFDRAAISMQQAPNYPERPLAPLMVPAPDADEKVTAQRAQAFEKLKKLNKQVYEEQTKWDGQSGPGQHKVCLVPRFPSAIVAAAAAEDDRSAWSLDWSISEPGFLAAAYLNFGVCVWSVATLTKRETSSDIEPVAIIPIHGTKTADVKWFPDSLRIAVACRDGTVRCFDLRAADNESTVADPVSHITAEELVAPTPVADVEADPKSVFTPPRLTTSRVMAMPDATGLALPQPTTSLDVGAPVNCVDFSPTNANRIAVGTTDGRAIVFDLVASVGAADATSAPATADIESITDDWSKAVRQVDVQCHVLDDGDEDKTDSASGKAQASPTRKLADVLPPVGDDEAKAAQEENALLSAQRNLDVVLAWSPHDPDLLATAGGDWNSVVLDVAAGTPQDERVLFTHKGHGSGVQDVAWSWQDETAGQLLTCDEKAVMAWKIRNRFWNPGQKESTPVDFTPKV